MSSMNDPKWQDTLKRLRGAVQRLGSVPSITCPKCGITSYLIKDIEEGYCGRCHDWTGVPPAKETP